MIKPLTLLFIVLAITACGKKDSGPSSKPEQNTNPVRDLELTQKEAVSFIRKEQMISRYDCAGNITSRKIETTNSLSKKITIEYENRKKAWSYEVYNRRTKSSKKGAFTDNGNFIVDYAPTVFNMQVKEGINDIEYTFKRCTKTQKNPNGEVVCVGVIEVEREGLIQVDVTYSSTVLPGEQHIRPSCKES